MAAQREQPNFYEDPKFARILFSTTRFAWLWAIIRVWLGYQWIQASLHKIGVESWTGNGVALKGFWDRAISMPQAPGRPPITYGWYRDFIQYLLDVQAYTWFAKVIAYGELIIGIALVIGAFVGIAAFFGAFMNINFMLAGTASTNPVLFTVAILLVLAWKVAGYYGVDRYLLPALGTPWKPGKVFTSNRGSVTAI